MLFLPLLQMREALPVIRPVIPHHCKCIRMHVIICEILPSRRRSRAERLALDVTWCGCRGARIAGQGAHFCALGVGCFEHLTPKS